MRGARAVARLLLTGALVWAAGSVRAAEAVVYGYDVLGRIASACFVETARLITFSYDAAGNRSSVVTTGAGCGAPGQTPNQPPQAVNDAVSGPYYTFDTVPINVLANDSDPDGDPLTITDAVCVSGGCLVFINGGTLSITGTTAGTKSVTYTISDGRGGTDSATAMVSSFLMNNPDCEGREITPGGVICF